MLIYFGMTKRKLFFGGKYINLDKKDCSYIARQYFGKSAAWLQQRIYGYKVRGKVYTLSKKDIETFNFALQDISKKIGSLSIS